ncbi:Leukocyte antigen CD37 [Orchesella cincta]|uniref:Tetraspanin n=1 Tax=Orchesella cincta TaxID=48709 RepID=A0A1D2N814_ORCCI|nr:Leukocyte antigen CD37 [Orchesella cincta]
MFALCGAGILTLGAIILRDVTRNHLFMLVSPGSGIITQVGCAMLGIGGFTFLTAILGCSAGARKCSIGWYIFCVILILMAELALGVHFLYFYDSLGKDLENTKLVATLTSSYGLDPTFTQSVDFAQHRFNCCGVQLDTDYDRSEWRKQSLGGTELLYPWTCCPLNDTLSDPPVFMNPVPQNASQCQIAASMRSHRYREGCLKPIEEWFRTQTLTFIGMGLTLLLLQIASLSAAICLCRKF